MKFALAGNPNSGKTTLFNTLTGSTAHVGNWAGVTVDKKEGVFKCKNEDKTSDKINIIDLPGIYSLSPYTPEEVIARQYIMDEKPDLIINIVDATNLERNLYLTTQLLEIDIPVIVALNMMDVIEKEGSEIDVKALSEKLGIPVIPICALRIKSVNLLMQQAIECAKHPRKGFTVIEHTKLHQLYEEVFSLVKQYDIEHPVFHTIKLLENDSIELRHDVELTTAIQNAKLKYETQGRRESVDYEAEIADLRYKFITDNVKPDVIKLYKNKGVIRAEKIDKLLTSRIWGIPIFLLIMFTVFHLIFAEDLLFLERANVVEESIPSLGVLLQGYMEDFQTFLDENVTQLLEGANAAPWAIGLIVDGLINGICSVLTFLPQILLLFLFLSILEDSGYMSRIAFLMDRPLKRFGLSGKAFIPMLMGFGCSVPAMMGTRTLDNEKEKRLTLMLIPFFSCGAKMAIWSIIVAAVFPSNADLVVFAIYVIGIVVAVIAAYILKKTVFKKIKSNFVMELPAYRLPRLKNTLIHLWEKMKGFVINVTTIIAVSSIIIWVLLNFDIHFQMVAPENSGDSILGVIGNALKWIFIPLGFAQGPDGWKLVVAIFAGLMAKEAVVSTLGVLYTPGFEGDVSESAEGQATLITALTSLAVFSPLTAMSFMIFNLLSIPCFAAIATVRAEFKSAKWTFLTLLFWFAVAWIVSFLVYQIGSLFIGANWTNIAIILFAVLIVVGGIAYNIRRKRNKKHDCVGCGGCSGSNQ